MKKSVLICLLLLVYGPAFGASSRILPVSYNESTYGDATREYTSLATWEADTDNNLVAAANGEVLTCYDDDDAPYNDSVLVSGAVTSEDYFRVIRAAPGHRGTPTSGVRFEKNVTVNTTMIGVTESYCGIYDLGIKITCSTSNVTSVFGLRFNLGGNYGKAIGNSVYNLTCTGIITNGSYVYAIAAANASDCIITNNYINGIDVYYIATNSVLTSGIICAANTATRTNYVYNNTVRNVEGYGISVVAVTPYTSNAYIKNNISVNNTVGQISANPHSGSSGTENLYQTTNATSGVTFADDGYHLASNDTGAIGLGTDLSADEVFAFDDDIDGETRDDWDIGADEYVASITRRRVIILSE